MDIGKVDSIYNNLRDHVMGHNSNLPFPDAIPKQVCTVHEFLDMLIWLRAFPPSAFRIDQAQMDYQNTVRNKIIRRLKNVRCHNQCAGKARSSNPRRK